MYKCEHILELKIRLYSALDNIGVRSELLLQMEIL